MGKVSNVSEVASAVTEVERCRFLLNLISDSEFLFDTSCFLSLQLQILKRLPVVQLASLEGKTQR